MSVHVRLGVQSCISVAGHIIMSGYISMEFDGLMYSIGSDDHEVQICASPLLSIAMINYNLYNLNLFN